MPAGVAPPPASAGVSFLHFAYNLTFGPLNFHIQKKTLKSLTLFVIVIDWLTSNYGL